MNEVTKREREPELKEITMAYEIQLNRMEAMTINLRDKVRSIYNPPQLEPETKLLSEAELKGRADDALSELHGKNERLESYNNRLEDILKSLGRII